MYPGQIPQPLWIFPFSPALPPVIWAIHPLLFPMSPLLSISNSCPEIPTPSVIFSEQFDSIIPRLSEALRYPNQPLQNKGGFDSAAFWTLICLVMSCTSCMRWHPLLYVSESVSMWSILLPQGSSKWTYTIANRCAVRYKPGTLLSVLFMWIHWPLSLKWFSDY